MRYENRGTDIIKHDGGKEFVMVAARIGGMDSFVWEEIKQPVIVNAELFDLMKAVIDRKRAIKAIRLFLLARWDVFFENEAVSIQCRDFKHFDQVEAFMNSAVRAKPIAKHNFWK